MFFPRSLVLSLALIMALSRGTHAQGLRDVAAQRNIGFGCAIQYRYLTNAQYMQNFERECGVMVFENELKLGSYFRPSQTPGEGTFDWSQIDALVGAARRSGMTLRGHTLVYHLGQPDLSHWSMDYQGWKRFLEWYITEVVTRYRGVFTHWDVVNEA